MQKDIKETEDTEALDNQRLSTKEPETGFLLRYEKPTASVSLYEIYKELVLNPEASFLIE